jgi:hypothetical protein
MQGKQNDRMVRGQRTRRRSTTKGIKRKRDGHRMKRRKGHNKRAWMRNAEEEDENTNTKNKERKLSTKWADEMTTTRK